MRWMNVVVSVVGVGLSPIADGTWEPDGPTTIQMDFTRKAGFFAAPFPSEDRRTPDGRVSLDGFPNRGTTPIVDAALDQIEADARGFSTTAAIFFSATGRVDAQSLPRSAHASLRPGASVYLLDVERGARHPIDVAVADEGGRFGAPNLISLLPYQGVPLRPNALYAAVVTTGVRDAAGKQLVPAPAMKLLHAGGAPRGLGDAALAELRKVLPVPEAAAIAVFRTGDPAAPMRAVRDAIVRDAATPNVPLAQTEAFTAFCVYRSTIDMPQYQAGTPPFARAGGRWVFDAAGAPVLQRRDRAGLTVTLPRGPMPPGGHPVVVFARTGAGGDRALVDHGASVAMGDWRAGSGPALEFARAGFAAISIDGPMGGLRNPDRADEQFLIFNGDNPAAIRDNIRQSAVELVLAAHVVDRITIDARDCGGPADARLDGAHVALFGHSMGATFAPLALAFEPKFKAAILSGMGSSYVANILHKEKPVPVRPLAAMLFGYTFRLYGLQAGDPALSMLQWAMEPADPPVYGPPPAHVLMFQGLVDHYLLPPSANASSLSLGLDLAGDERDLGLGYTPFRDVAGFAGRGVRTYPVAGNVGGRTAVVVQHDGDGIQDGHEVVFQREGPKHQYRCFLAGLAARGIPPVVAPKDVAAPCE